MRAQTPDLLRYITGLSLTHIFDLSCSAVMQVKYNFSETCDLSPRKLLKSKTHHLIVPKKQLESSLCSTGVSDAVQREETTTIIVAFALRLIPEDSLRVVSGRGYYNNPGHG